MDYEYTLIVKEKKTGEQIGKVEALSLESLQEQLHKVESMQEKYEEQQEDYKRDAEAEEEE